MRGRIDFKYALGLEPSRPGFDHTVLAEFCARLIAGNAEQLLLDTMLTLFKERGWRNRTRQATHGFDACVGQDPRAQPPAVRRRNVATSLLSAIYEAAAPGFLPEIPAVEILRQVWVQNYTWSDGKISWRSSEDIPPAAHYIGSPYDIEAHYSKKRSTTWVGYKGSRHFSFPKSPQRRQRALGQG